jgi:hypothetical protein
MLLARGDARLMFFDELKLPFFKASDSSDSALKSGHFLDILSLPFPCLYSVSAHAPDVASRPFFRV